MDVTGRPYRGNEEPTDNRRDTMSFSTMCEYLGLRYFGRCVMVKRYVAGLIVLVVAVLLVNLLELGQVRGQSGPGNSQCCQIGAGTDCQGCYNFGNVCFFQLGDNTYNVCVGSPDPSMSCTSQKQPVLPGLTWWSFLMRTVQFQMETWIPKL